ncbi:MAG: PIN domain-containing protein [Chlorobi bacterium]|nr:PIN domain-containing protein [Chlorobiota bacterium]
MKNTKYKVLVDTDVLMDFVTKREPFDIEAAQLFNLADKNLIDLFVSSLCLNNVYYLVRKQIGHKNTIGLLIRLVEVVDVLSVDKQVVMKALTSRFNDFEDALQHFTAVENSNIDVIVTRNLKDYKHSSIAIMTAGSFVSLKKIMK